MLNIVDLERELLLDICDLEIRGAEGEKQREGRFFKGPLPFNADHSRKNKEFTPLSGEAFCCQCTISPVVPGS